jgi:hypothetical protein
LAALVSVAPESAYAQEYPWCLSRESYLYCFYKTQEQRQWTAFGIGGCALNPRLFFRTSCAIPAYGLGRRTADADALKATRNLYRKTVAYALPS